MLVRVRTHLELMEVHRARLEQVKVLRGLLPICSHCKRIRDGSGGWQQLEVYIDRHSEAEFTHGLCPDCMHEYYPKSE